MSSYNIKKASGMLEFMLGIGLTKTKVRQLIKHRSVTVNDRTVNDLELMLAPGDRISFDSRPKPGIEILEHFGIHLVHEDDALLVINKPSGLLTIATEKEKQETAYFILNEFLKQRNPSRPERIFIVHRLDRETSGLIVFAKTDDAKRLLQKEWEKSEKRYFAVVEGAPKEKEGKIESFLGETGAFKVYSTSLADSEKHAVTRYRVIRPGRLYSLLDILIETGRKHQIRVHLADIGCPVVGDKKYGAKTNPIRRIALHAYCLAFVHPVTRNRMVFTEPVPKSFSSLVK